MKVFDFLVSAFTVDRMSCTCDMNHEFALHELRAVLERLFGVSRSRHGHGMFGAWLESVSCFELDVRCLECA